MVFLGGLDMIPVGCKVVTRLLLRKLGLLPGCYGVPGGCYGVSLRFQCDPRCLLGRCYLVAKETQLVAGMFLGGCHGVPDGCYDVSRRFQYDPSWLQSYS
ncbi:hypothetical protein PGIGA_G00082460 [Pangasianodon gigas]|uniref:Uncharacterized protein n=1 Tax=Pangasianodon gigas TaxID=30993 RepID=A0ACC5XA23_PANGG|nr:hypothetical protein [Pangasianodon gigas]